MQPSSNPDRTHANPFDRWDIFIALAVFSAAMVLYVRTLAHGLLLGDSAEFQVLGYTLGMAHTTGYPVYLLLAKLITLIPVEDVAYRVNLASAIFGAATLALLYLLGRCLGGWRAAALAAPVALGLTRLFWWHSVIAEVYTPAAAFAAGILLLVVVWRRTLNPWLLFAGGLLGGLGIGVHGLVLLVAPAVLVYLAVTARRRIDWGLALGGALAGVLLWLAAFWVIDRMDSATSVYFITYRPNLTVWGLTPEQFNSSFWTRLYIMVSGRQFHEVMFTRPLSSDKLLFLRYTKMLMKDFPRFVVYAAPLGWLALLAWPWRSRPAGLRFQWREGLLLVLSWAGMMAFVFNYDIGDIQVFYIPGFIPLLACSGLALSFAIDLLARLVGLIRKFPKWPLGVLAAAAALVCIGLIVSPRLKVIKTGWRVERITFLDATDDRWYPYPVQDAKYPRYVGEMVSRQVEDNAMVFSTWDIIYPILYVTHVEQGRTGIEVYEVFNALSGVAPSPYTIEMIRENFGKRPIYFTNISEAQYAGLRFKQVGYNPELFLLTGMH